MLHENIIFRAQEFARNAHESIFMMTIAGLKRPQLIHLQEVADLVWASGGSDEEISAGWLHDSVEDIEKEFGDKVAHIVHGLTDLDEFTGLPLAERKQRQAERIKTEDESVKRVKLADQTSNVRFLAIDPPDSLTHEECGQYIKGAKLIADECHGISLVLEHLFDEAYRKAELRYLS